MTSKANSSNLPSIGNHIADCLAYHMANNETHILD
jgi:hypothetical protein